MKRIITVLISCLIAGSIFGQDEFCRPVADQFDGTLLKCKQHNDSVKVFAGEWFATIASQKANIQLSDNCILYNDPDELDNKKVGNTKKVFTSNEETVSKNHQRPEFKICKKNNNLYVYVKSYKNAKSYKIINQTANSKVKESKKFNRYCKFVLNGEYKAIRLAVENHVSVVVSIDTVTAVHESEKGTCIYYLDEHGEKVDSISNGSNPESNNSSDNVVLYIIAVIIVLIIIVLIVLLHPIIKKLFSKGDSDVTGVENDGDKKNTIQIKQTTSIKDQKIDKTYAFIYWREVKNVKRKDKKSYLPCIIENPKLGDKISINPDNCIIKYYEAIEYQIPCYWQNVDRTSVSDGQAKQKFDSLTTLISLGSPVNNGLYAVDMFNNTQHRGKPIYFRYCNESISEGLQSEKETLIVDNEISNIQDKETLLEDDVHYTSIELINQIPPEYDLLKSRILSSVDKEKENIEQSHKNELVELKQKHKGEIEKIKEQKDKEISGANDKYKNLKDDFDKKLIEKTKETKEKAQQDIDKANKDRQAAEAKAKSIKDEMNASFENERKKLVDAKQDVQVKLENTKKILHDTSKELDSTKKSLTAANANIDRLVKAQEKFTNVLTYVPFAEDYSRKVKSLIKIANEVRMSATKLLSVDKVEDPYHIMKALAKYDKVMAQIDTLQFYTDIQMITEGQMVLKGTTLSTYNQNESKDKLHNSLKVYFFDSYLEKYINALVVLNESCIGLHNLVVGLTDKDTKIFKVYRSDIAQCVEQLEIAVETTRLFDKVGSKIDLQVTQVDAGFDIGDIIEIENCLVYFKGGNKPQEKIKVKAQS